MMELHLVSESEKVMLSSLVNEYLKIHCSHQEPRVGPETVDDYIYYPEYWREKGRYPYFIRYENDIVGFVLVRTVFERDEVFYQVSDFYIQPQHEGRGYGTSAVLALWSRYPGKWELDVLGKNARAKYFWASCIKKFSKGNHQLTEILAEDGLRLRYNFEVVSS